MSGGRCFASHDALISELSAENENWVGPPPCAAVRRRMQSGKKALPIKRSLFSYNWALLADAPYYVRPRLAGEKEHNGSKKDRGETDKRRTAAEGERGRAALRSF